MPDRIRPGGPQPPAAARRVAVAARLAVVAGGCVLSCCAVVWWQDRPAPSLGAGTVTALVAPAGPAPASASPPAEPSAPVQVTGGVPTTAARLPTEAEPVIAPVRVRIGAIGVDAAVTPSGVGPDGAFGVPADVRSVGWYRYGPGLDAATGSVVLVGHVDDAVQGRGAFFGLRELRPGDVVDVTGSDRRGTRWRVVAREEYPKARIDLGRYVSPAGARRLTMITCGGPFDAVSRHYRDNLVVTAVPLDP